MEAVKAAETTAIYEVTKVEVGGRQAEECMIMAKYMPERGERGGYSALGASVAGDICKSKLSVQNLSISNGEPTLRDVLHAIQNCNNTLNALATQFNCLREDVTIMHLDMQKVRERTLTLENKVTSMEMESG